VRSLLLSLAMAPAAPVHAALPEKASIAVVLNANAKAVDEQLIRDLKGLLQDETLFVSHSLEQGRFIARHLVNRRFDVVLCGGGDGTFTQVVSEVARLRPAAMPAFGALQLGTGNGIGEALGAGRGLSGLAADLRAAREPARLTLPLLEVEGKLTPFAGVGLDALILQDHKAVREALGHTPLRPATRGALGYAVAIATRSIWRYAARPLPRVLIRNQGAEARYLDHTGRAVGPAIGRGEVIYSGPVTVAAASTIPYYGFSCRLFPFADRLVDRFQLRLGRVSTAAILAQLPALFRGEFRSDRLWDFACSAISIESAEGAPLQLGGDLIGPRQRVTLGLRHVPAVGGSGASAFATAASPQLAAVGS